MSRVGDCDYCDERDTLVALKRFRKDYRVSIPVNGKHTAYPQWTSKRMCRECTKTTCWTCAGCMFTCNCLESSSDE